MPITPEQRETVAGELKRFATDLNLSQKQKLHGFLLEAFDKVQEYKQQNPGVGRTMKSHCCRLRCFAVMAVALLVVSEQSLHAQTTVGGHIGFLVPWFTHAGGETTSVFDSYSFGMPFGISVQGQGRMFVDFEFIPTVNQSPHETVLTVDPGVLYKLNHGFTVGLRAAFDVNSPRVGFVPLVNKSWKLRNQIGIFKTFFGEIDLPVKFSRPTGGPATNPFTFATQFGFGF